MQPELLSLLPVKKMNRPTERQSQSLGKELRLKLVNYLKDNLR